MWSERGKTVALAVAAVVCFAAVSELEYQSELRLVEARWERCVHLMGVNTDLEASTAAVACAEQTGYILKEEDYP